MPRVQQQVQLQRCVSHQQFIARHLVLHVRKCCDQAFSLRKVMSEIEMFPQPVFQLPETRFVDGWEPLLARKRIVAHSHGTE